LTDTTRLLASAADLPPRIRAKILVNPITGCWEWLAGLTSEGYGQLWWEGANQGAHQVVYRLLVGPVPDGLEIDHLCRFTKCVNPAHMEPVTGDENRRRGLTFLRQQRAIKIPPRAALPVSLASEGLSPALPGDILAVVSSGEAKVWNQTAVARLAESRPEIYGGWEARTLTFALRPYGVVVFQVWGTDPTTGRGANRNGFLRQAVADAFEQALAKEAEAS
jgi:HNH endonuclease